MLRVFLEGTVFIILTNMGAILFIIIFYGGYIAYYEYSSLANRNKELQEENRQLRLK